MMRFFCALCALGLSGVSADPHKETRAHMEKKENYHHYEDPDHVRSEHAPWFRFNKTSYFYERTEKVDDGWVEDQDGHWVHKDHRFSLMHGGGFNHHHIEDPVMAHITGSFHPIRMKTHEEGMRGTKGFQLFFSYEGHKISPWHDIPMIAGSTREKHGGKQLFNFICEIPKGSTAKFEINKEVKWNPIIQDTTSDGELRSYLYAPEGGTVGSLVNYGAIVQTWEDPKHIDPGTGVGGDNDPIDVLQLNSRACKVGEIYAVRVLGALALIDGDETDWKLIVVNDHHEESKAWMHIDDIDPQKLDALKDWFENYKTAEGKPKNRYGYDGKIVDEAHAIKALYQTHMAWKYMVKGHHDGHEL